MELNKVYNADLFDIVDSVVDDKSVDVGVYDPPYNISTTTTAVLNYRDPEEKKVKYGKGITGFNEEWDKFDSIDHYMWWTDKWINLAFKKLKDDGSMFIFGSYHNIGLVNHILQKQGRMIINDIAWYKRNAVPNIACRRLQASYETILWVAKSKKYRFNYKEVKAAAYEKDSIKKEGKQLRNVWDIPTKAEKDYKHPSKKPIVLIERCLDVAGIPDGLVLDFFGGSGTTAAAAMRKNMNFILVEKEKEFADLCHKRIRAEGPAPLPDNSALSLTSDAPCATL
jgi:DNA modification methylase